MLQNARVTAFTVIKGKPTVGPGEGGGGNISPLTQIRVKVKIL